MKSRSKYHIDDATISLLFTNAGIEDVRDISPLGAGEYNSVYSVNANGKAYALKIAPHSSSEHLKYEENMIEQEVYYYKIMKEQAGIRVPYIHYVDLSGKIIPAGYFIMERLEGQQLDQSVLTEIQKEEASLKLTAMVAAMHRVKGERFGYRQNGLHDNWYEALSSMVLNLISDCEKKGHKTRGGRKLLKYVEKHREILETVESTLIMEVEKYYRYSLFHFGYWRNFFVCRKLYRGSFTVLKSI